MATINLRDSVYEAVIEGLVLALSAPTPALSKKCAAMVDRLAAEHLTLQQVEAAKREALRRWNIGGTGEMRRHEYD